MAKSSHQKQKLLVLADYLLRETDESHPVSIATLISHLDSHGIRAERKSLYDDLEQLQLFGLDVVYTPGRGYFIGERSFQPSEVKLLVDVVQSSRFLTRKKSDELIEKLASLVSRHEARDLAQTVFADHRIKAANETIYLTVNTVSDAIRKDSKIRFRYYEWDRDGTKKLRRDGAFYRVSPHYLIWDDENYYLVAWDGEKQEKRHYRVDKMTEVSCLEESREGKEFFRDFDPGTYERKLFGMFNGTEEKVTVWCAEELAGVFFDRFGGDLVVRKAPGGFETTLSVLVGPAFFGWVMSFGDQVRILSPESTRLSFCDLARRALSGYGEESTNAFYKK